MLGQTDGLYMLTIFFLIAVTISALESFLRACESDLQFLDMSINVKKSSRTRIGHRHNVTSASIATYHGQPLHWVSEFRYFGVIICFIAVFQMFTCVC